MAKDVHHAEVVAALTALGNPARGRAIQQDRGSALTHLGIGFPALRKRVRQGFSFTARPAPEVLAIWDGLWRMSPVGDVLFAAIEWYAPQVRKQVDPGLWPVVRRWAARVDNWCHADALAGVYSWILASDPLAVYPQLKTWNRAHDVWLRRISLVSLIHYTGKHAVFLAPAQMLPLISNCLDDDRHDVQMAVGWVLRELGHVYKGPVTDYLKANVAHLSAAAFARAIERRPATERDKLRAWRKRHVEGK